MGMSAVDENVSEMSDRIVEKLNKTSMPLIIFDEADKLHDKLFQFFITFYNNTYTNCGFVFLGSVFFRLNVLKAVNKNKQGYAEFFSRVGRQFVGLKELTDKRVAAICKLNSVSDPADIMRIWNESENDMRRVKRMIQTVKKEVKIKEQSQLKLQEV
jgi:DNA transposition AAA+ family ATPase